jgi:hypothetical protein
MGIVPATLQEPPMRADTRTISIDAEPAKVVRLLADPRNLPRWAVGFAKTIRREAERWYVLTNGGEVEIRIAADERSGVVDFFISPAPNVEALAASRVIPRGKASEYVFTQFQAPGMPEDVFEMNVNAVQHELTVLKAIAEVECPL